MRRNKFKYRCADCGWTGFFHLQEFARSFRPHCGACGCTMLDPTHDEAVNRLAEHATLAAEQHAMRRAQQGFE